MGLVYNWLLIFNSIYIYSFSTTNHYQILLLPHVYISKMIKIKSQIVL